MARESTPPDFQRLHEGTAVRGGGTRGVETAFAAVIGSLTVSYARPGLVLLAVTTNATAAWRLFCVRGATCTGNLQVRK